MILKKGKKFIEIKSEYDQKYVEARLAGVDTDDILWGDSYILGERTLRYFVRDYDYDDDYNHPSYIDSLIVTSNISEVYVRDVIYAYFGMIDKVEIYMKTK